MTVEYPVVVSNPTLPLPKLDAYRAAVREVYIAPAATTAGGMPIVHADTVSISDEARTAYRRMIKGSA
ncbi:MAG: hypothetical protein PVF55_08025 [Desulfobacterales bacterium]|jgi:hypothetical protein